MCLTVIIEAPANDNQATSTPANNNSLPLDATGTNFATNHLRHNNSSYLHSIEPRVLVAARTSGRLAARPEKREYSRPVRESSGESRLKGGDDP